jgi:hypothetical protein
MKEKHTTEQVIEFKKIAKYFNDYVIIDFNNQNSLKEYFKKQSEDLVNIVLPSLIKIAKNDQDTSMMRVFTSLVINNLVTEKKITDVLKNLKEMQRMGVLLEFDNTLMDALKLIVG